MSPRSRGKLAAVCVILISVLALGCAKESPDTTPGSVGTPPPPTEVTPAPPPPPPPIPELASTEPPEGIAREYPDEPDQSGDAERQDRIVEVFYGTDRKLNWSATTPEDYYTGERGGDLDLGICQVNIPPNHKTGELEAPKWWRLEFRWNPERHVMVLEITRKSEDEWLTALSRRVGESAERSAFVFVHGYNVSFNDAARRAGQMAYDLRLLGFSGAPILYSWPSRGRVDRYTFDEASVRASVRHLTRFLELVTQHSGAEVIHLIAHSMGNRAVTEALGRLAASAEGPLFNQIALVAPDIDAELFKEDIVPAIRNVGQRLTLYASADDKALGASEALHGYPRAGNLKDGVVIVPGLDTIDASDVETSFLAHSYFADSRSVIGDLVSLFLEGKGPADRGGLIPVPHLDGQYWKIAATTP